MGTQELFLSMTLKLPHPLQKQGLKCGREFCGKTVEEIFLERVAAELFEFLHGGVKVLLSNAKFSG